MAKKPKKSPKPELAKPPGTDPFLRGEELKRSLEGLGFDRVQHISGSTYRDNSTIVIVPEREDRFHWRVVQSWQNLIAPMNQKRWFHYVIGDEVGRAYDETIKMCLGHPELKKFKFVLTLESDNIIPPDAHVRLLESIEEFRLDAVGGIYFTKGEIGMPMCYGDPFEYQRTGVMDFRPRDLRNALQAGNRIVECNGLAMGCTLYRLELFKKVPSPWFVTVADIVDGKGAAGMTQDLYFCKKAKEVGARFAVDTRVRVGHLDLATGTVY